MAPKAYTASRIQSPIAGTICTLCSEACIVATVKCSTCKNHFHPNCTGLPDYHLAHWFYGRISHTCRACLTQDSKNDFDEQLSFVLDVLERERHLRQTVNVEVPSAPTTTNDARGEEEEESPSFHDVSDSFDPNTELTLASNQPTLPTRPVQAQQNRYHSATAVQPAQDQQNRYPQATAEQVALPPRPNNNNTRDAINERPAAARHSNSESRPRPICPFYKKHICRYGRAGHQCPKAHPKVCPKLKAFGRDRERGCPVNTKCPDYHPQLCRDAELYQQCLDPNCPRLHIKGTQRFLQTEPHHQQYAPPLPLMEPKPRTRYQQPTTTHKQSHTPHTDRHNHHDDLAHLQSQQVFLLSEMREMKDHISHLIKLLPWQNHPPTNERAQPQQIQMPAMAYPPPPVNSYHPDPQGTRTHPPIATY